MNYKEKYWEILTTISGVIKKLPLPLFISFVAWLFGLYINYQSELRQDRKSTDTNEQKIAENYFSALKEIRYNQDYKETKSKEYQLIHNMTLVVLREISGSPRKAGIVLFLNKLEIPKNFNGDKSLKNESSDIFYHGANLKLTNFKGFSFKEAQLTKGDLRGSTFKNAGLKNSNFNYADLSCHTYQKDADWGWLPWMGWHIIPFSREGELLACLGWNLQKKETQCADLSGANLTEAELWGSTLKGIKIDEINEPTKKKLIDRRAKFNDS
ncbi:pentapeptide repeat-containing protein [Hydrocoleum sp. CS-953]|uniref:pentapeptide repeat-containing protein n=1 Tax=Microcoleaceae TaxID=1892252 RepID=UPI000B9B1941|nr:pentapeptide repeat-containing protein [Hydrocoleum sp. CS-953]OZH51302.1 hypothetical protein AFK68_32035 [Hydrocoleum sp. CS-953]